jgi:hypothetical protein
VARRVELGPITDYEGNWLLRIVRRSSGSVVTWRRAQMVLLAAQAMPVGQIVRGTFTSEDRVRDVLRNFNADGFGSLYPRYWGGRPPTFASPSASRSRHSRSAGRTTTTRPARPGAWTSLPASWPLRGRGHQPRGLPELLGEAGLSVQRLRTCKRSPTQTMRCKEPDPAPVGAAGRHRGRPARRPGCGHVPRRVRPPQPPAPRIGSGPPWPHSAPPPAGDLPTPHGGDGAPPARGR